MKKRCDKKIFLISWIIYCYLLFVSFKVLKEFFNDIWICLIFGVIIAWIGYEIKNNNLKRIGIKGNLYCSFFSILIAFCFTGNTLFYSSQTGVFDTMYKKVLGFFGFSIFVFVVFRYIIQLFVEHTQSNVVFEKRELEIKTLIIVGIWIFISIIYLIAYNPANMFPDTYNQLQQINHIIEYSEHHPIMHTLMLKFLLNICNTPIIVVLVQIAVMAYVLFLWIKKFLKIGVKFKWLIIFSVLNIFNVPYGLLITNIWKDTLYNISLLGITYFLLEVFENRNIIKGKFFWINYSVFMFMIYSFRHNGVIPFVLITIPFVFILGKIQKNKIKTLIIVTAFIVMSGIVAKGTLIHNNDDAGTKYIPFINDIASILVTNPGNLTANTRDMMLNIIPLEDWQHGYNSCDSDTYTYHTDNFFKNLNKLDMGTFVRAYTETLFHHPIRIISARLMGSQLQWNVFKREGTNDYIYEVDNTPDIAAVFGYERVNNGLKNFIDSTYNCFEKSVILNTILYRSGIYFVILLFVICVIIFKNIKLLYALFPVIGNSLSLFIAMTCQHLRYTWSINIISLFMLIYVWHSGKVKTENRRERKKVNG